MRPARERRLQLRQGQEEAITPVDPAPPRLPHAPQRIISLVPAHTASLFDLGLGARLVGRTRACTYPAERVALLRAVGEPAEPVVADILALQPDLVLAHEGTSVAALTALAAAGVPTWVTPHPRTVRAALTQLWELVRLCDAPQAGHSLAALERSYEITRQAADDAPRSRVFCPSARAPEQRWLVATSNTYLSDLLHVCGGANAFADLAGDPAELESLGPVSADDLAAAAPDVILLPSGPFTETDLAAFDAWPDLPAVAAGRVYLVDAALLTWPGTHLARALAELPALLHIPSA